MAEALGTLFIFSRLLRAGVENTYAAKYLQSAEKKGLRPEARPAEAVGLVLGIGADDIGALEDCDWATGTNRTRRVKR